MLGWFRALMPKDDRFFDLFARHSRTLVQGAVALEKLLQAGDAMQEHAVEIATREQEADEITREVLLAVRRTFITPFDRGDIQDLIQSMDDAIDQMNKTVKAINLFEVRSFSPDMREMGSAIVKVAELTADAIPLLRAIGTNAPQLDHLEKVVDRFEDVAKKVNSIMVENV